MLLTLTLLWGLVVPLRAAPSTQLSLDFAETDGYSAQPVSEVAEEAGQEPEYAPEQLVRVSIVLEKQSTLEAGFSTLGIAQNQSAMSYRRTLQADQNAVVRRIEQKDVALHVQWNLTLAANIISADIRYGDLETIAGVPGVKDVFVENQYEPCVVERQEAADPNMATSGSMIGSAQAYAAGYTGAGTKIAIIDTGLDLDHQSFDPAAFDYALGQLEGPCHLMDTEDIAVVLDQLNCKTTSLKPSDLYRSTKVPFGYNYVDKTAKVIDHDSDQQGEHGSHVAGIAAANRYIANGDGTYTSALSAVNVQGVAPDAQLVIMKVFGQAGGAHDSDYMAAIEDAIILGCQSVNLSLGSGNPGFTRNTTYQEILDSFVGTDTTVTISAGNSGHFADAGYLDAPGYLYGDDVNMHTGGSPGTYTNSLCVASADNSGSTGYYFEAAGSRVVYTETTYNCDKFHTLAGEREYVLIDGVGTPEQFAAVKDVLEGKIAFCSRGETAFADKANAATACGAVATVVYNNQPGTISMDLTSYTGSAPCVSITQQEGDMIRAASTPVTDENGAVLYYTGKITVSDTVGVAQSGNAYYTMSTFSSYGVPGNLIMKPEITAPGGSIYSVNGAEPGGQAYEVMSGTSMAAPQVAGMAALISQYIQENKLDKKTGLSVRTLTQSLLMSTAVPMIEEESLNYYSILRQGAGLANVGAAVTADSYILMDRRATDAYADGKVKVELKDDPDRTGVYTFGFTLNNLKDTEQKYTLSADLFTQGLFDQDGVTYLDNMTVNLMANAIWTVDGKVLTPDGQVDQYDFNGDGVVNGEDVQAILDYVVGIRRELINADLADLDGNGAITSYDAWLLLQKLNTGLVTLPADGKVTVTLELALTEDQKAALNESYENGAYLEGYIFVKELPTAEGVEGTAHSIPLLGFYGNWSDPSMFDHATILERLYGLGYNEPNYVGPATTNSLAVRYPGDSNAYYYTVNPLGTEDTYPAGREAISAGTTIVQITQTMIRNAAGLVMVVTNDKGDFLYMGDLNTQVVGAFYYTNAGSWYNPSLTYSPQKVVSTFGVQEGDRITVSAVAIPELYEQDGELTEDQVKELISEGKLGHGAYLSQSFTVDNTAPVVESISKEMLTGSLTITARDNNYVAGAQVMSIRGEVYATAVAKQETEGGPASITLDLSEVKIGPECVVVVSDYAGNQTAYTIDYGGEPEDFTGNFYGFTYAGYRGSGNRWMQIDPEKLYFVFTSTYGGTTNVASMDIRIVAAEYVDGYVYMADNLGGIYIAEQGYWESYVYGGSYLEATDGVVFRDMAFNYQNNTLYALDDANNLYTVDTVTCEISRIAHISVVTPQENDTEGEKITMLAIDDLGNFYTVNYGSYPRSSYLYQFTLGDIVDGEIEALTPVVNTTGEQGFTSNYTMYGSMAYDHDADVLYMAGSSGSMSSGFSYLVKLDTETGVSTRVNETYASMRPELTASKTYVTLYGLYIVPGKTSAIKPSREASSLTLDRTELSCLLGGTFTLHEMVLPWNLRDKSVSWTSSDSSVATVNDGVVTAVGLGKATITATTSAAPNLTATCEVTVHKLDKVDFSGLVYNADGEAYWSDVTSDAPEQWTAVHGAEGALISGAALDDLIFAHDGDHLYAVDADTFEIIQDCGVMAETWLWSDAAPAPEMDGMFGKVLGLCNGGTMVDMVGPMDGTLSFWTANSFGSALSVLAYVGSGTQDYSDYYNSYTDCPAHFYYMMTEDGELWDMSLLTYNGGETYILTASNKGPTGVNLQGTSDIAGSQHASMIYDQETGYLLLASYAGGQTTQLYAIDPETQIATELGDFGKKVWPVVSLYQHQRPTELTVKLRTSSLELFAEETKQLVAHVLPATYADELTWTSSDEAVATVDANGVVTALKEGTATITATSVATDGAGRRASASCLVNVTDLTPLNTTLGAQITTEDGTQWISFDTATRNVTVNANAEITLTGAGAHDGKIYGTDSDYTNQGHMWQIDPAQGYQETRGSVCTADFALLDATTAPGKTITVPDYDGNPVTRDAFDFPMILTKNQYMGFLLDFEKGEINGWNFGLSWIYNFAGLTAVAYAGDSTYTDTYSGDHDTKAFYVLDADGTVYLFHYWGLYDRTALVNEISYSEGHVAIGNIGMEIKDPTAWTMTYFHDDDHEGLILGHSNGSAELYYVDLTSETLNVGKIASIPGATGISGLYTDTDMNLDTTRTLREGTDTINSSERSFSKPLTEPTQAENISLVADQTTGGLNAAALQSEQETRQDLTLPLSAKDASGKDVASTNGLLTVTYDPEALEVKSVHIAAEYRAVVREPGKITFAYANSQALEEVGTVTFVQKVSCPVSVQVQTLDANEAKSGYVDARTMDHAWGQWTVTQEPDCFRDGEKTRTCRICGETETEVLPKNSENCPSRQFTDLNTARWYHPYTDYVVGAGLMNGVGSNRFAPDAALTRGMLVTTLYRLADEPEVTGTASFTDLRKGAYYEKAVAWAQGEGIVKGVTDTLFAPDSPVTREQAATFLYRYITEYLDETPAAGGDLSGFRDAGDISGYAKAPVAWAVAEGFLEGYGDGILGPRNTLTRAQMAKFLTILDTNF